MKSRSVKYFKSKKWNACMAYVRNKRLMMRCKEELMPEIRRNYNT